ncbi:ABC transporter permease [Polaribacter porphyrae]|uniref:ABC transporter permease n=1 Tax=Polaribacter porphyrae TaxID=1137780 RepID=A0A2S7WS92_9FLAO|nr:FtsX-like permease family protein [Polaribacter porphyrae]PQJ80454.1 ABC transporter permease [Polaribacter porphyrae]
MSFPLYIAKRYLFSKTSNNAINIITIIASFGVIVGAAALFIILSGFSGLRTFSYSLLDASDPDIKIISKKGKSFIYTDNINSILKKDLSIKEFAKVIEERVFLEYNDKNEIAYIKGVQDNYSEIIQIDSSLFQGNWLDKNYINTAVVGRTIANKLSLGINNFIEPLSIMVPKPGTGFINANNAFYKADVQTVGLYTGTEEFESKFVFVNLELAEKLLNYTKNQITGLELKLVNQSTSDKTATLLQEQLGNDIKVQTREQLNEVYYKVLNTENFVIYLIFTLVIIIALFNVIGTILMMIIDKKQNLKTLLSLGSTIEEIKKIFVYQGFLLTLFGMIIGLVLATIIVILQKQFSLFMITQNLPYPVEFKLKNLSIVIFTILVLGYLAAKIASSRINRNFIEKD